MPDQWAPLDIVIERVFEGTDPDIMRIMLDDLDGLDLYAATVAATGINPGSEEGSST